MTRIVPAVSDAVLRDIIGDAAIVSIAFYCIAVALLLLAEGSSPPPPPTMVDVAASA